MRSATIVVVDEDGEAGAGTASVERVVDQDQDPEEEQALAEGYRNNQYYGADGNESAAGDGQSWAGDINNLAEDDDQDDDQPQPSRDLSSAACTCFHSENCCSSCRGSDDFEGCRILRQSCRLSSGFSSFQAQPTENKQLTL